MIKFFLDEKWKEIILEQPQPRRYAVSNYGRIIGFNDEIENGNLLKGGVVEGYKSFHHRYYKNGKKSSTTKYVHRLVAEYFLPKNSPDQIFVIHLDYKMQNNHYTNLKWVTNDEMTRHKYNNPSMIENRKKLLARNSLGLFNRKLTETQVKHIKKMIFNPNRKTRLKIIARQFGISEMQLYRIKTGENWGHITI